jgi:hypothetical protein
MAMIFGSPGTGLYIPKALQGNDLRVIAFPNRALDDFFLGFVAS